MANTKLVLPADSYEHRFSIAAPQESRSSGGCSRRESSITRTANVSDGRLEIVRGLVTSQGFSKEVAEVVSQGHREGTMLSYRYAWRKFCRWCSKHKIIAVQASLACITEFFLYLYNLGLQVNTIGVYRAALSATLPSIEGFNVGNHPFVCRMFKGLTNLRPRKHKIVARWEVDKVLETIVSWGDNWSLDPQHITWKLVMLCALVSGSRCSELSSLDTRFMFHMPDGVKFQLTKHKKNRRSSVLPGEVFFPTNPESALLCPCACMKVYLEMTKLIRTAEEDPLFRGLMKPYLGVTSSTISRWLSKCISSAGFHVKPDARIGHSVRGHSTTKAKVLGLSTQQILKAAEWRSESVFRQYYFHPSHDASFGRTVLQAPSVL